jgi:Nif-specific regulatory protein
MFKFDLDPVKFETFIEINTLINSDYSNPRALLQTILESATRLTEGEASSLLLVNQENRKLYFEIALGAKGAEVKRFALNPGEGIAGWVAEKNRSLIVNDVDSDSRFSSDISKKVDYPTRSILAVPMRIKDRCVGVIEILNKKGGKPFDNHDLQWLEVFANQAALAIQNARSFQAARQEIDVLQDQVSSNKGYHTLVYSSKIMEEKLSLVKKVADTDSSVLILGESGVGKELFAEQIHLQSPRKKEALVRVNCAALPETLLESELFGHVKGAFTDAQSDRKGRFEIADRGTIFLDEIGELPLKLQAKMLRVIQQKTFEKLGSSEPVTVDVRIIAATNKDIEEEIAAGTFRSDLYYRLNVLPLHIPPLRQRTEDIPELVRFFLTRFNRETKKQIQGFTDEAMELLLSYSWPGNVRELENVVERAVVICQDNFIGPAELLIRHGKESTVNQYYGKSLKESVNLFKRNYIKNALEKHNWHQTEAAKSLGIQRTYLSKLIRELDIKR